MATIQIRHIPESVHRIYRSRAAACGMSLQEYLLAEIVHNASLRTPTGLVAEVEEQMRSAGNEAFPRVSSAELVRTDRESH